MRTKQTDKETREPLSGKMRRAEATRLGQGFNPASQRKAQRGKKRAELFHCSTRREEEDDSVRKLQPCVLRHSSTGPAVSHPLCRTGDMSRLPLQQGHGHGGPFFPFPYPTSHHLPILVAWFCLHLFQLDETIWGYERGR